MVPQNGQQPRAQQPNGQNGFPNFMPAGGLDTSTFGMDSPEVAKQMAALAAANQARISQNSRPMLATSGGTSSGSYLGAINNSHNSYSSNGHDLLNTPNTNGHANFQMSNNFGLTQNNNGSFLDPAMAQSNMSRNPQGGLKEALKIREQNFLQGLATTFAKRNTPLPPAVTGIPFPNYDPHNSPWAIIEAGAEPGYIKLAGKDVNLFKLWGLAVQQGGSQTIDNTKQWPAFLPQLGLPEEYLDPQTNIPTSVAKLLRDHYMNILGPFEQMYWRNVQDQQKKMQMSQGQGNMTDQQFSANPTLPRSNSGLPNMQQNGMRPMSSNGLTPQALGSTNNLGQFLPMANQQRPPLTSTDSRSSIGGSDADLFAHTVDSNLLDQDIQGIKRKHDSEGADIKRVRQKTDPPEGNSMLMDVANNMQTRSGSQPPGNAATNRPRQAMRRKIEYVPLAREVDTHGGRDVHAIDAEWTNQASRRPVRDINDWSVIETEHLCLSLRSRLSIELSYALTTFTVLSTLRGQTPGSGFPIGNRPDLLDDTLDLLEELAFGGPEKNPASDYLEKQQKIFTNRELTALVQDEEARPFAPLQSHQGSKDPSLGPLQRPANTIHAIIAIIRNLSIIPDNMEFLASFPRLADLLLRLCEVEQVDEKPPSPVSTALSLADLLLIRREVMIILISIVGLMNRNPASPKTLRIARRTFELVASYLVDPEEAVSPLASVQLAGVAPTAALRPPPLADVALEVFTRFSQSDANRQLLTKAIPQTLFWQLLTHLVHRVPLVESDFLLMQREYWASFVEKVIMGLYSIIFMAPYELKQKIKSDRRLGIKNVLLRMAQRVLLVPNHDGRGAFMIPARRAVEAIKLLDKAEEKVDAAEPALPALQFGMGFSDGSDSGIEKGTGLLGANKDVAWEMLSTRDVWADEIFFSELDSLVRVECQ